MERLLKGVARTSTSTTSRAGPLVGRRRGRAPTASTGPASSSCSGAVGSREARRSSSTSRSPTSRSTPTTTGSRVDQPLQYGEPLPRDGALGRGPGRLVLETENVRRLRMSPPETT